MQRAKESLRKLATGASAPQVRRLAGHLELGTTQRYAHAADADLRGAIDALGGNSVETAGTAKLTGPSGRARKTRQ